MKTSLDTDGKTLIFSGDTFAEEMDAMIKVLKELYPEDWRQFRIDIRYHNMIPEGYRFNVAPGSYPDITGTPYVPPEGSGTPMPPPTYTVS